MPYISRDAPKYELGSKKRIIIILTLFVLAFILALIFQITREKKLRNSVETIAIIQSKNDAINGGAKIYFFINKKKIEVRLLSGTYKNHLIGDSILIKYAIEDPTLVQVVDKYYMQKYK
jgi:hypothetical protein